MTPPPLPDELLATLPPAVLAYIRALEAVIATQVPALAARVAELEARLGRNSANSSRPPSSDGPHVEPAPPTPPSGKAKGGQPGHPRNDRPRLPPDAVVELRPPPAPTVATNSPATTPTHSSTRSSNARPAAPT